jgi:hypothetical protein
MKFIVCLFIVIFAFGCTNNKPVISQNKFEFSKAFIKNITPYSDSSYVCLELLRIDKNFKVDFIEIKGVVNKTNNENNPPPVIIIIVDLPNKNNLYCDVFYEDHKLFKAIVHLHNVSDIHSGLSSGGKFPTTIQSLGE